MRAMRAFGGEERGEEEGRNDGHEREPVDARDEEENEGERVDKGGEEQLTAFSEQEHRKDEKHVVVEVEVGGEQERRREAGAEGCREAAGGADEVDGNGEDEDGEECVEGEGDVRGKKARAADVEKTVERGHRLGIDGDDGLDVVALVRADGGRGDEAQPGHHALGAGDEKAGKRDRGGGWQPGENQARAARGGQIEDEEEEQAEGDLELEEAECEEDACGAVVAGGERSPEETGEEEEDDGVLAFGDAHEGGEAEEEEHRARDFGDARVGWQGSEAVAEEKQKEIEDDEGDVGVAVGEEGERSVEECFVGGMVEGDAAPHGADDDVLDGGLDGEVEELGGVVEEKPAGAVEGAEVVKAAGERQGGAADGEGDEGKEEPGEGGAEGDAGGWCGLRQVGVRGVH